jgi:hypothetical protein
MTEIFAERIRELLERGDNARNTTEKGNALVELMCYIFGGMPGITITHKNEIDIFKSEEIDLALWNDRNPRGFHFLPYVIIVECKNWSKAVSSAEVGWFDKKLQERGMDFGILVAANGITGDPMALTSAHHIIATALNEGRKLIVITRSEIEGIVSNEGLVRLVKGKLCELAVRRSCLPRND